MSMKYVTLRVWHPDCWMLEASERHRDIRIESRGVCSHGGRVHTGACITSQHPEALRAALDDELPRDVRREVLSRGDGATEIYSSYPAYRSLYEATVGTGFLVVSPIMHHDGAERWEILADASTLDDGLRRLRERAEVRVERIGDAKAAAAAPAPALLDQIDGALSDRQVEVLTHAVKAGYYGWPRGAGLQDIARELNISAPTALEHIRNAERRIVPAVLDRLLRSRAGRRP